MSNKHCAELLLAGMMFSCLLVTPVRAAEASPPEDPPRLGDPLVPSRNPAMFVPPGVKGLPPIVAARRRGEPLPKKDMHVPLHFNLRQRKEVQLEARRLEDDLLVRTPAPAFQGACPPPPLDGGGDGGQPGGGGLTDSYSTTIYPWRTIGRLYIWFNEVTEQNDELYQADGGGTGALVGPCHLLTAGHNVYNHEQANGPIGWAKRMVFVPGLYEGSSGYDELPYGAQDVIHMITYESWTQDADPDHDWAFLVVDQPIGDQVGWFGYSTGESGGEIRNVAGYPTDLGSDQYWNYGEIDCDGTNQLKYDLNTLVGMSGGPVWRYDGTNRYIHGIHAYGTLGDFCCGFNCMKGAATRITSAKFDYIQEWKAEYSCAEDSDDPDLAYDGDVFVKFLPLDIYALEDFRVEIGVRNLGVRPAPRFEVGIVLSRDDTLDPDDFHLGLATTPGPAGCFRQSTAVFEGKFPPGLITGQYRIGWVVDPRDDIREVNERNNQGILRTAFVTVLPPAETPFRRGDASHDGLFDIADAVFAFSYLFLGGSAPACVKAADANNDGDLDITDGVAMIGALFLGGPPIPLPGARVCGDDPTPDGLSCIAYEHCR